MWTKACSKLLYVLNKLLYFSSQKREMCFDVSMLILISFIKIYYILSFTDSPKLDMNFKLINENWLKIDLTTFATLKYAKEKYKTKQFVTLKNNSLEFLTTNLEKGSFRGDYSEAMALSLLFLGGKIENYTFKAPQSMSKARWMSRLIYALKLYLFQSQFDLSEEEIDNLETFCVFGSVFYIKNWIRTPFLREAGNDDLAFYNNMHFFKKFHKKCAESVIKKIENHTWYLSGELIGISLFSQDVAIEEKRKIVDSILSIAKPDWQKRCFKAQGISIKMGLADFVNCSTLPALEALGVAVEEMLLSDPESWKSKEFYETAESKLDNLIVINDVAERNVKLGSSFSSFGTKNEKVIQQIYQNVADIRKKHTKIDKKHLKAAMQP